MGPLGRIGVETCSLFRRHVAISQALEFGTHKVRRYSFQHKENLSEGIMSIIPYLMVFVGEAKQRTPANGMR